MKEQVKIFTFEKEIDGETIKATIEVNLRYKDGNTEKPVFSCMGQLKTKDFELGGQCLDEVNEFFAGNPQFDTIYEMWKKHHLNDLHAGTPLQEKALKEAVEKGILESYGANNYTATCDYLKSISLYEVFHEGKLYKYGHGWLYFSIPKKDLKVIENLFK